MTDQGWSNWWCERQRYGVVVAAAAVIRGWRNQTESTHRQVAMSCWPRRRGRAVLARTDVVTKRSARTRYLPWLEEEEGENREYLERGTWW